MALPDDPIRIEVPPELAGLSAQAIAVQLGGLPPDTLAELLIRGGLWVDGRRLQSHEQPLAAGALLQLRTPPGGRYRDAEIAPEDLLYEDAWIVALNKRPGWYVSATPWDTLGSVIAGMARFLAQRDGATPPLHLAHQLDRDTSGVLLLSKRPEANEPLHRAFAGRLAHKRYLAICQGHPAEASFRVETGLGRGPGGGFYVYPLDAVGSRKAQGRPPIVAACTDFAVIAQLDGAALVAALPITGRTHQIRLHLMHAGHPLLGDARYGGPPTYAGQDVPHHMLHAARLELPHPATGNLLVLEAPPPATFTAIIAGPGTARG